MKPASLVATFVCALALSPSIVPARAEDKVEEGWIVLFDGTDLSKWKASEKAEWKIEDGAIVTPPQRSHLFTLEEYKNFEFKADCMTTPGSNSGLYIHTKYEETFPATGYEIQVNQTHGDRVKSGSLYGVIKLLSSPVKDNEWYTYHLTVKGRELVVKINDQTLYEFVEPRGITATQRLGKGSFALQGHDPKSKVFWKNIRVKPLAD